MSHPQPSSQARHDDGHDRDPAPLLGPGECLATGAPGITLLHIEYARAGIGGWDTVGRCARAMTHDPVPAHPDECGLYRGAPAVAFALRTARRPAYATALRTLDHHITTATWTRLRRAHQRIDHQQPAPLREFDLISGLTGLGVYLLHRRLADDPDQPTAPLADVLSYLVRLTEPLTIDGEALPGWWCAHGPGDQPSARWPGGHANLGIAHGIAGPLALLATTLRRGILVPGQPEAIARICMWLDQWRVRAGTRMWWPGMISRSEWRDHTVRQPGPRRPSWCYGVAGLARAQQLAGLALGDLPRQRAAEQALTEAVTDEHQLGLLTDASLCHGWAGLLQTTWRAATDADDGGQLTAHLPLLRAGLHRELLRQHPLDRPGLLDGITGIHLAQHSTTTGPPPTSAPGSGWDACLLITG